MKLKGLHSQWRAARRNFHSLIFVIVLENFFAAISSYVKSFREGSRRTLKVSGTETDGNLSCHPKRSELVCAEGMRGGRPAALRHCGMWLMPERNNDRELCEGEQNAEKTLLEGLSVCPLSSSGQDYTFNHIDQTHRNNSVD